MGGGGGHREAIGGTLGELRVHKGSMGDHRGSKESAYGVHRGVHMGSMGDHRGSKESAYGVHRGVHMGSIRGSIGSI